MASNSNREDLISDLIEESRRSIKSSVRGLKQKIWSKSQRWVLSSQVWLHAAPTQNCDVLLTLPPNDPRAEFVITWLVQKVRDREPRLVMELRYHSVLDSYGLYLTAKYENLLKGAEMLHMKKRLKKQWGGGYREFVLDELECYEGVEHKGSFLTSQERASIVLHLLQSVRASHDDTIGGLGFLEGQSIVPILLNAGFISQLLPLHNSDQLKRLQHNWLRQIWAPQPLDQICEYFGEKIGIYFAWLSHYTKALCAPAFFGLLYWMFVSGGKQLAEDVCFVAFALFNIVWATVLVEWWKRAQAEYAYSWGTLGMETNYLAEPRPYFRGELKVSQVTGRLEPHYPGWKRRLIRYCFSYPLTFLCLLIFFLFMLLIFQFQEITDKYFYESTIVFNWIVFVPKFALAFGIFGAAELYTRFAIWLNDFENYRTDDAYEDHLIHKIVVFQVISSFLPVFYMAFYVQDMEKLRIQLAALLITRQVIGNLQEAVVPYFVEKFKLSRLTYRITRTMSDRSLKRHVEAIKQRSDKLSGGDQSEAVVDAPESSNGSQVTEVNAKATATRKTTNSDRLAIPEFKLTGSELCQAEVESLLPRYSSPLEDYLEMFIQFGFVVLFAPVFPLAPACCLLNNVIEIRVDAFKLCTTMQRPFGRRVENIGAWETCVEFMGTVAVIVNCVLIAQSGLAKRFWPDLSWGGHILIVVVIEHVFFLLKFIIAQAIPDIPAWVRLEMSKVEFLRREAFRRESRLNTKSRQNSGNNTQQSKDNGFEMTLAPSTGPRSRSQARK